LLFSQFFKQNFLFLNKIVLFYRKFPFPSKIFLSLQQNFPFFKQSFSFNEIFHTFCPTQRILLNSTTSVHLLQFLFRQPSSPPYQKLSPNNNHLHFIPQISANSISFGCVIFARLSLLNAQFHKMRLSSSLGPIWPFPLRLVSLSRSNFCAHFENEHNQKTRERKNFGSGNFLVVISGSFREF
jgi:hypothetical protein